MRLVTFFVLLGLFLTQAATVAYGNPSLNMVLLDLNVDPASYELLKVAENESSNRNEYLRKISESFPEIRIVVLPSETSNPITWRDSRVGQKDYESYLQMANKNRHTGGSFFAPWEEYPEYSRGNRPLADKPLVLLRDNIAKFGITHEMTHYLIYKARREKFGSTEWPNNTGYSTYNMHRLKTIRGRMASNSDEFLHWRLFVEFTDIYTSLFLTGGSAAEEVSVAMFLIQNRKDFSVPDYGIKNHYRLMDSKIIEARAELKKIKSLSIFDNYPVDLPNIDHSNFHDLVERLNRWSANLEALAEFVKVGSPE